MSEHVDLDQAANSSSPQGRGYDLLIAAVVAVLVVSAVTLVVLAFLQSGRERRYDFRCLSHLRQLQLASLTYAMDNDERLPPGNVWCDVTAPYVRDRIIYTCPAAQESPGGYRMNSFLQLRTRSSILEPARTFAIFDSDAGWNMTGGPDDLVLRHAETPGRLFQPTRDANVAFADGHVKYSKSEPPGYRVWDPSVPSRDDGRGEAASSPFGPELGE
mgnify:CR=1 FL=1